MDDALLLHRLHFAFTITYHYLFPQLTMGLAPLIVFFKSLYLWKRDERYNRAALFLGKIFAIAFIFGVVTGIPMEFQFGTNWARFARAAGGVIGQTLAMEGLFAFFLESAVLGVFLFGEKKVGPRLHWLSSVLLFLGTWLSGYFIVATNAWMQHPVGYEQAADGRIQLADFWSLIFNPWAIYQYLHNMGGAFVTGSFVVAALGAFFLLNGKNLDFGRMFVRTGVVAAFLGSVWMLFPSGDFQAKMVAKHQPVTLAAMEGVFKTDSGVGIVLVGQPNVREQRIDNPIIVPNVLSFMTYQRWDAELKGLDAYPKEDHPDNIALLYYAYHIMVGLGTIFIAIMTIAALQLWRGKLFTSKLLLWVVMLAVPLPFIANTAGWMTSELGRQPWLVYGLVRTTSGFSSTVSAGNALFTLLGFMGIYTLLSILYLFLIYRVIENAGEYLGTEEVG